MIKKSDFEYSNEELAEIARDNPDFHSPAFQLYVNDFLGSNKITMMKPEGLAGYTILLFASWNEKDCGLPTDVDALVKLSKLFPNVFDEVEKSILENFFEYKGRYYNRRLLLERKKQINMRNQRTGAIRKRYEKPTGEKFPVNENEDEKEIDISNNKKEENIEIVKALNDENSEEKPNIFKGNDEFKKETQAPVWRLDYFESIARQKIPESFIDKWKLWVDICAERNDPVTKSEAAMQLSQLREISIDVDIGKIIDETIKSRHKGFTFTIEKLIKEKKGNGEQNNTTVRKFAKGATSAKDINAGLDKAFGKDTVGAG